jgi:hypothetical protein
VVHIGPTKTGELKGPYLDIGKDLCSLHPLRLSPQFISILINPERKKSERTLEEKKQTEITREK